MKKSERQEHQDEQRRQLRMESLKEHMKSKTLACSSDSKKYRRLMAEAVRKIKNER